MQLYRSFKQIVLNNWKFHADNINYYYNNNLLKNENQSV